MKRPMAKVTAVSPRNVMTKLHKIRKRFGGGMRQSGMLAAGALYGLEHHLDRLVEDHEAAQLLARTVDGAGGSTVVAPDTNIVMIDLPAARADAVCARARGLGVLVSAWTPSRIRAVTHLDAPTGAIEKAAPLLRRAIEETFA